jgi:hypothetical protein
MAAVEAAAVFEKLSRVTAERDGLTRRVAELEAELVSLRKAAPPWPPAEPSWHAPSQPASAPEEASSFDHLEDPAFWETG